MARLSIDRAFLRVALRVALVLAVLCALVAVELSSRSGVLWRLVTFTYQANVLLHVVVPLLAITDWVLIGRGVGAVRWWQPFAWLVYPAAYAALALAVLNQAGRRAPYYFLDPGSVGIGAVVANTSVLALGFLGLGYLLLALARRPSANA